MIRWPEVVLRGALEWLGQQWNEPSRADNYIMRLIHETRYLMSSKRPPTFNSAHYRLEFHQRTGKKDGRTPQQQTEMAKAAWVGRVGGKVRHAKADER